MVIGSVSLCREHRRSVLKHAGELLRLPHAYRLEVPEVVVAEAEPVPDVAEVVYYIGDPDQALVKIGTSGDLFRRLTRIRYARPRALLLATEPGGVQLETRRHRQFRALHQPLPCGETEWFRKVPVLMDHVTELRHRYGIITPRRVIEVGWVASAGQRSVTDGAGSVSPRRS